MAGLSVVFGFLCHCLGGCRGGRCVAQEQRREERVVRRGRDGKRESGVKGSSYIHTLHTFIIYRQDNISTHHCKLISILSHRPTLNLATRKVTSSSHLKKARVGRGIIHIHVHAPRIVNLERDRRPNASLPWGKKKGTPALSTECPQPAKRPECRKLRYAVKTEETSHLVAPCRDSHHS